MHVHFAASRSWCPGLSADAVVWPAGLGFQPFLTLPISENRQIIHDALDLQERLETKDRACVFVKLT